MVSMCIVGTEDTFQVDGARTRKFLMRQLLDHPGRVTLKTEELFVVLLLSSTIREGDP